MKHIAFWVAFASMTGTIANSFQKKWCFYIWICTNLFWIIHNMAMEQYAQGLLYIFNFITCIIGLVKWKKK